MIVPEIPRRSTTRWLQGIVLVCAMVVLALGVAFAQDAATKASGTKKVHVEDKDNWNQFRGPNGDGKIYFSGKKGIVSVISAARDFQLLAENGFDASFIASPAIAGDAIILRSLTHLYCVANSSNPK